MGRIAKKHVKPAASDQHGKYITRSTALSKLQISLAQFRRLCILKGIYPRDPTNKNKGLDTTYFLQKDIQFLANDPMIGRLRTQKVWRRRITRAKARKEETKLKKLERTLPQLEVDHVIRERYPTFQDALRDMDDALCMLFLYSALPSSERAPLKLILMARRLILEFQSWVMRERVLRKAFISIKGIYFQAEIGGVPITWLVPHSFGLDIPEDVDFRVMGTFTHLYYTLCGFVNYKLYHSSGLHYPPVFDRELEESGESLYAVILSSEDARGDAFGEDDESDSDDSMDAEEEEAAPMPEGLEEKLSAIARRDHGEDEEEAMTTEQVEDGSEFVEEGETKPVAREKDTSTLFQGLKFFLGREIPRDALQFLIQCCGGEVSWPSESAPFPESDETITHHIIDRPSQAHAYLSRVYVQPQWAFDCLNARYLLPVEEYLPGIALPSHLSPFVEVQDYSYVPKRAREIEAIKQGKSASAVDEPDEEEEEDDESDLSDEEAADKYQRELEAERLGVTYTKAVKAAKESEEQMAVENEEGSSDDLADGAVRLGKRKRAASTKSKKKTKRQKRAEIAEEEKRNRDHLAQIMIERKKHRQLYHRVKQNQRRAAGKVKRLTAKAEKFEKEERKKRKAAEKEKKKITV